MKNFLLFPTRRNKRGRLKDTFMGFFISQNVSNFLNLYSIAHGITISQTIRNAVLMWLAPTGMETKPLVDKMALKIQARWDYESMDIPDFKMKPEFAEYVAMITKELEGKGVDPLLIKQVFKQVKIQ